MFLVSAFQPVQPEDLTASSVSAAWNRLSASAVPLTTASTVQSTWPGQVRELSAGPVSEAPDTMDDASEKLATAAVSASAAALAAIEPTGSPTAAPDSTASVPAAAVPTVSAPAVSVPAASDPAITASAVSTPAVCAPAASAPDSSASFRPSAVSSRQLPSQ